MKRGLYWNTVEAKEQAGQVTPKKSKKDYSLYVHHHRAVAPSNQTTEFLMPLSPGKSSLVQQEEKKLIGKVLGLENESLLLLEVVAGAVLVFPPNSLSLSSSSSFRPTFRTLQTLYVHRDNDPQEDVVQCQVFEKETSGVSVLKDKSESAVLRLPVPLLQATGTCVLRMRHSICLLSSYHQYSS